MIEIFNNRELSAIFWSLCFAAFALSKPEVRKSLLGVWVAFINWKILLPIFIQFSYIALIVYGLWLLDAWDISQLKNTIIWFVSTAFLSMFRIAQSDGNPQLIRNWIDDHLKIIVVIEFIANFHTLPFIGEFFLVPVSTILVMLQVVSETKDEYEPATKLINWLLSLIGTFLIGYTLSEVIFNFQQFANMRTAMDFYTPPLLSL